MNKILLCSHPPDASCPEVEISASQVTIGEDKNTVRLKPEEWNRLVELIKQGKLKKV